ncbi:MAG: protein translocase subunit SecD [Magnetococcales bacterium]|nr:protein translocase subunit SecD [Magnetococcales bacterium]MBF0149331.1 protein translocase subunit SecD [Magnetococcales bacterium]MBF0173360.1 protein translocase subunit SecD [Magnetococcales bacterium]MBF0632047.1 protein translocase subunit SecD [Magnetococcales bacterium]
MKQLPWWKPATVVLVTLISLLYAAPSLLGGVPPWWPSWLPQQVIARGLDLQGGLYLLLHVESGKAVEQAAENMVDDVRGVMRKEKLRYKGVEHAGTDSVIVKLSQASEVAQVQKALAAEIMNVDFSTEDDGTTLRLSISETNQKEIRGFAVEQSIQTIRSRIDQFGVAEPTIQKQGEDRILVQLPGLKDPTRAKALIGRTARLEFKMVDEKGDLAGAIEGRIPPGDILLYGEQVDRATGQKTRQPYLLKKRTVLSGDLLTDARVNFDTQFNEPYVSINFNSQGGRKFGQLTGEHVGERMAIVLDGTVYSAPVIRERIDGGRAQISGSFSTEEAHDLAIILRAGALPAPVTILEERTVGPTLGSDSIAQGMMSVLIGGALVIVFMGIYYKAFGWLANVAVVLNIIVLMAILAWIQATLTLPGIAGMVLLMGMSVDANVLIFERIREELHLGRTPLAAIDHGYDTAFVTILDSNLTTLITAVVLFQFGTGPVKGFAVTLSIGLIASMFTAIFVTRVVLAMIVKNRRLKSLSI